MIIRLLNKNDNYIEYFKLLSQLTSCTERNQEQFLNYISEMNDNYLIYVIEQDEMIIGSGR